MKKSYLGAVLAMGSLFLITGAALAAEKTTPSWDPTLIQAKSCAEVEGVFKEYFMSSWNAGSFGPVQGGVIMNDTATREALAVGGKGAGGGDFSATNNQKTGVDEPDIVKNDGKYVYYVDGNITRKVHIVAAGSAGKEESTISLPQDMWNFQLYLYNGKLVVLGTKSVPYAYNSFQTSMIQRDQRSAVLIYDVSNAKAPKLMSAYEYDGTLQESRLVDGKLVLMSAQYMSRGPVYYARDKIMNSSSPETLKPSDFKFSAREFLPTRTSMQPTTITYRNGTTKASTAKATTQVDCTNILYKKPDPQNKRSPMWGQSLTSILTFSLDNPRTTPTIKVVMGNMAQVHITRNSVYVTSPSYIYTSMKCPINARCIAPMRSQGSYTTIHKFALPALNYSYSTAVKGTTYSQYSMDDTNGTFRIVTSSNGEMLNRIATNIYTVDAQGKIAGRLENLAPGEQFHGVRFIDNYLYLVTYRQIDPLFVIDVSNAAKPTIVGQLKMPGYSTYLHPYGAKQGNIQYMIGLGVSTSMDANGNERQGGVKLDLYKIDFSKKDRAGNITVTQAWTKTFGDAGSSTEAMYNPRMFVFNPNTKELLLPMVIARSEKTQQCNVIYDRNGGEVRKECYPIETYLTDFAGIKGWTLSPEGLQETISVDYKSSLKNPYGYNYSVSTGIIDPWLFSSLMPRVGYIGDKYYLINVEFAHLFTKRDLRGVFIEFPLVIPTPEQKTMTPPPTPMVPIADPAR